MTTTATSMTDSTTTGTRIYNFSAGPAILPEDVLHQAQKDIWNIADSGIGIMEHSHRGPVFDRVIEEAEADCRAIAKISDDYEVLFLQGGATMQFAMIPMSFLGQGMVADYPDTGVWTTKAIKEAKHFGTVNVAFDGSACQYDHTPSDDELNLTPNAAYLHYCSNNTIFGTRYNSPPTTDAPLICDASSEMFSRPIDINRHAMVYAGAQKNLGPSGVTLVIIRKDFIERATPDLPSMLSYAKHAKQGSRLNTPPTFGIYIMGQVFKWLLANGGLEGIEQCNNAKAKLLYDAMDHAGGFYTGVSRPECRSVMNVSFRTPSETLDKAFLDEAAKHDMDGLKGHRDAGGLRASIYNAFPHKGCEVLADFMSDFAKRNG
jgi:phosphoserine aminotransferase